MTTTTNAMTAEQMAEAYREPTRADRRRDLATARRTARYDETGFVDRAVYVPFRPTDARFDRGGMDSLGNPVHPQPFSPVELMARAVQRRDAKRHLEKMFLLTRGVDAANAVFDNRAPHAQRSTAPRSHFSRARNDADRKRAFLTGVRNNANGLAANGRKFRPEHLNRGTRERILDTLSNRNQEAAALPMAA